MATVLALNPIPEGIPGSDAPEVQETAAPDSPVVTLVKKLIADKAPVSTMTQWYLKLRNADADLKKQYGIKRAPITGSMELIENHLLAVMNELQVDSLKNEAGTPYKTEKVTVSVADNAAFMDFVLTRALSGLPVEDHVKAVIKNAMVESGQLALFEARAAKTAVEALVEETKVLPPGLNRTSVYAVNVRAS